MEIILLKMALFVDLIKSGKIKTAYLQKQAALSDLTYNEKMIKALDVETPNVRIFTKLESDANNALTTLKEAIKALNILLFDANPEIASDEDYLADVSQDRTHHFGLVNAIEDHIVILNDKGITYPPEVKPADNSGDLAALIAQQDKHLSSLLDAQNKNQEAQNINQDKLLNTLVSSNDNLVKAQSNKTSSPKAV